MVAITATLTLAALEIGLRVAGDRERAFAESVNRLHRRWVALLEARVYEEVEDPVRRYAMRPGASTEVDGWLFRVNQHRARGADLPRAKPAGEKRLLALGDSFCFGLWCDEDETLVAHVARQANEALRARGDTETTWRAINLGVPGYHTGQQLAALRDDGLALDPDVVLVYFNSNDINREGFFLDGELAALRTDTLPLPVGLRRTLWSSHLYGFVVRKLVRHQSAKPQAHLDPSVPWSHNNPENRTYTRAAFAEIARLCSERDIPLFVAHQPLMSWSADAWRADWDILPLVDWFEEVRAELALPGVNLLGWMRGNADGVDRGPSTASDPHDFFLEPFFADEEVQRWIRAFESGADAGAFEKPAEPDFHLTGEGYGSMARVVYAALVAEGFLP